MTGGRWVVLLILALGLAFLFCLNALHNGAERHNPDLTEPSQFEEPNWTKRKREKKSPWSTKRINDSGKPQADGRGDYVQGAGRQKVTPPEKDRGEKQSDGTGDNAEDSGSQKVARPPKDGRGEQQTDEVMGDNVKENDRQQIASRPEENTFEPKTNRADDNSQDVDQHKIAGLSCEAHGGPTNDIAREMVYWSDIPSDSQFESPFKRGNDGEEKYLTFEPDIGGWNNLRMSMETVVALAHAMGRTLVLPPEQAIYLLHQKAKNKQKMQFTYADFFHFDSLDAEHKGLNVVSTETFLQEVAMKGNFLDKASGQAAFPPYNRTNWDGPDRGNLMMWLRKVAHVPMLNYDKCIAAFPSSTDPGDLKTLTGMLIELKERNKKEGKPKYWGNPVAVDAPVVDRMRELIGNRELCLYDKEMQKAKVVHLECDMDRGTRLLVHFYAFLFFQDWKQDLWTKRFIRDHVRYLDEIQCAGARVVNAVRERSRKNSRNPSPEGLFDTFHIRRGDFQYKETRVEASVIYENSKDVLTEGATLFIATDERNKTFFKPLKEHYDVCFLDDFKELIPDLNTNYYGMLDQLIASRGRVFVGAYYSTFTGFINRMRGYHAQNEMVRNGKVGEWDGSINSFYYIPKQFKKVMQKYHAVAPPIWSREFPTGWRNIDLGIEDLATSSTG